MSDTPPGRLSFAALFSFLLAILPVIPIVSQYFALVLGRRALRDIALAQGALTGRRLANAGIILAYVEFFLMNLIVILGLLWS